jgi:hypothetical protein
MLTSTPPATQTKLAITITPPPPCSPKTRRLPRQMMSWCSSTTTSWTHIHPLTYTAMCLLDFFAEPLASPWPMAGYGGCKLMDDTSYMLCWPSTFPLSAMPMMALAIRAFIPHAAPSSTAFGGHCLMATSNGMLRLATNANSARPHKSKFRPPLPPPCHFFTRSTLTQCSCPSLWASSTSYKHSVCSPHGLSGVPSAQRLATLSVHLCSRISYVDGVRWNR